MAIFPEQLQPMAVGSQENRVEALRLLLGYPLKQRDPEGSRFWFLRPGVDEDEAEDTCPIAVGFYAELNHLSKDEVPQFLTADTQQGEIYGHYTQRIVPNQPVMYLLLPDGDRAGRVAMVLPSEGKLRQRQIQSFAWTDQDLKARLNRLCQSELARTDRMQEKALSVIPLVEWAFYKPIETAKELAERLAGVSRKIEQAIPTVYEAERQDGYLHTLLTSFQRELLPTLKLKPDNDKDYSFADIYAQTISYGLFTARVFSYTVDERKRQEEQNPERKETDFNRQNAWERLPETNPFLKRLFRDVSQQPVVELGEDLADAIAEVFSILRAAKMDAILADFRAKMNREDIVIRFYEDFLAAYKPQMRERRGVYYTPEPVVSYMVRSVDILLKEKFDKPLGLADPEVMILDPACGTGTFLLWIFQEIYKKFQEIPETLIEGLENKSWSGYVKERLLPRIFGFELLMAPYAIAHLKLGLFLEETGYQFDSGRRLGVYLTNTLEEAACKSESLFEEFIAEESNQAAAIKRDLKITVVIGNPPYSYESGNTGAWIKSLLREYYKVDGQPLGERNSKGLQDDYVKFIRFGQWRIKKSGRGVFAYITNHSFLDNLTFRGMRQSLLSDFDAIDIYDLHGNIKKREKQPNGSPDLNVFDIQQGVSITFGVKDCPKSVRHCELYGSREQKYFTLSKADINSTLWKIINPLHPSYFFVPQNYNLSLEYKAGLPLNEIMPVNSSAMNTARNHLLIDIEKEKLLERIQLMADHQNDIEEIKNQLNIESTNTWNFIKAIEILRKTSAWESMIVKCLNGPFDIRYLFHHLSFIDRPRTEVNSHLFLENLSIVTTRQTKEPFAAISTNFICGQHKIVAAYDRSYVFPLYLYWDNANLLRSEGGNLSSILNSRRVNISDEIVELLRNKLGYEPLLENVFYYIYAILYSPGYRTRYAEFLKRDFPRVPLTSNNDLFLQLAAYGEELVALHLMKSPNLSNLITQFEENGNRVVDAGHPKYVDGKVIINKRGDGFAGVPEEVWNFYVGGYQVCQKWLKDRKGRTLSEDDIIHYQCIVVALQETIRLMQQIDEAIPGFPII